MFKKPLAELKTSGRPLLVILSTPIQVSTHLLAPLKNSDRRKLKQRVVDVYSLPSELGDILVPEGLLSQKFSTHVNEHGVRDMLLL